MFSAKEPMFASDLKDPVLKNKQKSYTGHAFSSFIYLYYLNKGHVFDIPGLIS